MATPRPTYYCHKCQAHIGHAPNFECPRCGESFIEEVSPPEPSPPVRNNPRRPGGSFQIHSSVPFGNTTIYVGGGPSTNDVNDGNRNINLQNFLQNILTHFTGGLTGGAGPLPFVMHNGNIAANIDGNNFDTILTQFLIQMGDNNGPAPAPETRINSIPTVKITADQARDNLQCAICMDDFKENDDAKRLPCSHHFHEPCISRWLRLHGTCPTCRIPLAEDNNHDLYNRNLAQQQQQQQSSNNNNNNNNNGFDLNEFD